MIPILLPELRQFELLRARSLGLAARDIGAALAGNRYHVGVNPKSRNQAVSDASKSQSAPYPPCDALSASMRLRSWMKPAMSAALSDWPTPTAIAIGSTGVLLMCTS